MCVYLRNCLYVPREFCHSSQTSQIASIMLLHWFTLWLASSLHLHKTQKLNVDTLPIRRSKRCRKNPDDKANAGNFVSKRKQELAEIVCLSKTWECNCMIPRTASSISLGKIAQIGSRMSFRCNNMSFSCRLHLNKKGKK